MTNIRGKILKITQIVFMMMGMIISGYSQNVISSVGQSSEDAGNQVVYNQSSMGGTILLIIAGLVVILLFFKYLGNYMSGDNKKNIKPAVQPAAPVSPKPDKEGEINAAIAMALYLYSNELHDQENPVITMIKVSKTYSPWSSKIYGLRKLPR